MEDSKIHQIWADLVCGDHHCCFCGAWIEQDLQPIVLPLAGDAIQALSAHGSCLKQRLDRAVPYLTPSEAHE